MRMTNENTPSWAHNQIGYQCFVDSFAIGKVEVENKSGLYERDVYGAKSYTLRWHEQRDDYHYGHGFYGGDLQGLTYAVNTYLADLGVTMLYLTPIFQAESNHKYDTVSYEKIDSQFGTIEDFRALIAACHAKGIKIILDGVFNHTSSKHRWYQKACEGNEAYLDYYKRNEEGFIICWRGVDTLPVLNHDNPDLRAYLYEGEDSIVKRWLREGIDGWRLDVAEELGEDVIRRIRKSIKDEFPDRLLVGEVMETYGDRWLHDDLLDGAMNYVFRGVTANFITNKITGGDLLHELSKMYDAYPRERLYASWNHVSTHDTNRMLYETGGSEALFKLAVALQFTYPGVPVIYYGDELGVTHGKNETSNRTGMDWECITHYKGYYTEPKKWIEPMAWDAVSRYNKYREFHKQMIWIRENNPVFTEGAFIPLYGDDTVIAFARKSLSALALVIINKGGDRDVTIHFPDNLREGAPRLVPLHGSDMTITLSQEALTLPLYGLNAYVFATPVS